MTEVSTNISYWNETTTEETVVDVRIEATSHIFFKVGEVINRVYFPILVPIGIMGNILSFLVMIQKQNRHMSISVYIAVLACTDTIALCVGFLTYLNMEHETAMPPDREMYCKGQMWVLTNAMLSSNLLVVGMTFDRFYSIIRPHKAASFNTVKRARITVVGIVIFAMIYNSPHLFLTGIEHFTCLPYAIHNESVYNQIYFWLSSVVQFWFAFVSLLIMNSVIIHTLRIRSRSNLGQGQSQGQAPKLTSSEKQIFVILILVAFSLFIFTSPVYAMLFYVNSINIFASPEIFAGYFLFYNVGQKAVYTNAAINFFLYVMSGKKFRSDLAGIFVKNRKRNTSEAPSMSKTEISVVSK